METHNYLWKPFIFAKVVFHKWLVGVIIIEISQKLAYKYFAGNFLYDFSCTVINQSILIWPELLILFCRKFNYKVFNSLSKFILKIFWIIYAELVSTKSENSNFLWSHWLLREGFLLA